MKAVMKNDDYQDLIPGYEYEVTRVFCDLHIMLEGSKRRYVGKLFKITCKGEGVSVTEAYRRFSMGMDK